MPRFYFHLRSKENHIPDDSGKELDNLNDAYAHARQLIDKIYSMSATTTRTCGRL
jgi:hypothetical protein